MQMQPTCWVPWLCYLVPVELQEHLTQQRHLNNYGIQNNTENA